MVSDSSKIATQLTKIRTRINAAAVAAKRNENDIQLLAVSKTKPVSDIAVAYENGQREFGENYVQEAVEKIQAMHESKDIVWHFIGPLQSNKSKFVSEYFDWMHSVDRLKIVKRLHEQRSPHQKPLNICIQVNVDDESSKAGIALEEVQNLVEHAQEFNRIRVRGLMCIPKANGSDEQRKASFAKMKTMFDKCAARFDDFDTLSMGMSHDLELAIECGATLVRVGTDIFGRRS